MRLRNVISGALLVGLVAFQPGFSAAQAKAPKRAKAPVSLSTAPPGILGFTPSVADPKLAASLSQGGSSEKAFRFTPAGRPGSSKSVTVAVRSRTTKPAAEPVAVAVPAAVASAAPASASTTPSAYNLGVSVGWSRFALSGGIAKADMGLAPFGRESVDVGLSYLGRNWRGTLQLGADRDNETPAQALTRENSYSVDLGGAYSVSRNLSLSGGVRYKRDEAVDGLMLDNRRDSQSVYVGTTFSF